MSTGAAAMSTGAAAMSTDLSASRGGHVGTAG